MHQHTKFKNKNIHHVNRCALLTSTHRWVDALMFNKRIVMSIKNNYKPQKEMLLLRCSLKTFEHCLRWNYVYTLHWCFLLMEAPFLRFIKYCRCTWEEHTHTCFCCKNTPFLFSIKKFNTQCARVNITQFLRCF